MDVKLEGMDWIHVVQGMGQCQALANTVTNLWVLLKVKNFLSSWSTTGLSKKTLLHGVS
jgi:hypothetical protein